MLVFAADVQRSHGDSPPYSQRLREKERERESDRERGGWDDGCARDPRARVHELNLPFLRDDTSPLPSVTDRFDH